MTKAGIQPGDKTEQWLRQLDAACVRAMKEVAAEGERTTRENVAWESDTGSAKIAITGYLAGEESHTKHYSDAAWRAAQRRGGIRWPNPPENYVPYEEQTDTEPDALTVIVTQFVRYGQVLEEGYRTGGYTFFRAFEKMKGVMPQILRQFLRGA